MYDKELALDSLYNILFSSCETDNFPLRDK